MSKELIHQSVFEKLKHIDKNGNEYWSARDMAKILEYSEYRHFLGVIEKAKKKPAETVVFKTVIISRICSI